MGRIVLETDSQILVKALESTEYDLSPEGILFSDIRSFIRLNFISVEVRYAPRTCNKLAHELAAIGAAQRETRVSWLDYVPESVHFVLASEFAESR